MAQKIMSIGAHADDVEINTGGTLAKYHDQGGEIVYVMATNNMSGSVNRLRTDGTLESTSEPPLLMMQRRKGECDAAAARLGTRPIHLDHPQRHYTGDNGRQVELRYGCALPEGVSADVPSILTAHEDRKSVQRLAELILAHDPVCVFTHTLCSSSIEHVATCLLVTNSYRQASEAGYQGALLHCREHDTACVVADTGWDTFVDISGYLDRRMELIGTHACQMPTAHYPTHGHRTQPLKWGAACGCQAAEVFTWAGHGRRWARDNAPTDSCPFLAELARNTR